jgi:hypothetical protein
MGATLNAAAGFVSTGVPGLENCAMNREDRAKPSTLHREGAFGALEISGGSGKDLPGLI